jgi:hypothetical protein
LSISQSLHQLTYLEIIHEFSFKFIFGDIIPKRESVLTDSADFWMIWVEKSPYGQVEKAWFMTLSNNIYHFSKAEIQYVQGHKEVSKSYDRRIRCLIRKRLDSLYKELSLLSALFADKSNPFICTWERKSMDLILYKPRKKR